jgi:hypothetical protein
VVEAAEGDRRWYAGHGFEAVGATFDVARVDR